MKNLLFIFCLSIFYSCSQSSNNSATIYKSFSEYEFIGEIHNDYLIYANSTFPDYNIFSISDEIEQNKLKLKAFENYNSDKTYGKQEYSFPNFFLNVDKNECSANNYSEIDEFNITEFQELLSDESYTEVISQRDIDIIIALSDLLLNQNTSISDAEEGINLLIEQWNSHEFDVDLPYGDISAAHLSIAKHSLEFWKNNPDALINIHNLSIESRWVWVVVYYAAKDTLSGLASHGGACMTNDLLHGEAQSYSGTDFLANFIPGAIMGSIF
jgi:hypothetical protein